MKKTVIMPRTAVLMLAICLSPGWGITGYLCAQSLYMLQGEVKSMQGEAVAYASIATHDARAGTLSDEKGHYSLRLPAGSYRLTAACLGFATRQLEVNVTGNMRLDIQLTEEDLTLEDVVITSDGRDPAYGIIRRAIDRKKNNAWPYELYQYKAYTKTAIGFPPGFSIDSLLNAQIGVSVRTTGSDKNAPPPPDDPIMAALKSPILYLSETVSEAFMKKPDKLKERILSSRVSGASDQFSFAASISNRFDPYQNLSIIEGVADRGLVSPISDNAFLYYDYKLLGAVRENGVLSYKIRLIPKRNTDPVYDGVIYIADSSYAVRKLDFTLDKSRMKLLDSLNIRAEYVRFGNAWLPVMSVQRLALSLDLLALKIPFSGFSSSILSDYVANPALDKRFFSPERISVADSALKKRPDYWEKTRPVPLTTPEYRDYRLKDSLEQVRNSPAYLDSLTRLTRKVNVNTLLLSGHTFRNYRKQTRTQILAPLNIVTFNPMEGWALGAGLRRSWDKRSLRNLSLEGVARYTFGNDLFSWRTAAEWQGSRKWRESFRIEGGHYISQFSRFEQLPVNYSLVDFKNYLRLYRKQFAEISWTRDLFNGLTFSGNLRYERRFEMPVTVLHSPWSKNRPIDYAPNFSMPGHDALVSEFTLTYQPFNRYMSTPQGRIPEGSKWPTFEFNHRRGWAGRGPLDSDFSAIRAGLSQQVGLGLLGTTNYRATYGRFLQSRQVNLPDLFHFKGNEIFFAGDRFDEFFLMPYYRRSSVQPFIEAHAEHAFGGFLFNKLPGLRRLKLNEYAGVHLLWQEAQPLYAEAHAGIGFNLLKFIPIRVDLNVLLTPEPGIRPVYFKLRLPLQAFAQVQAAQNP